MLPPPGFNSIINVGKEGGDEPAGSNLTPKDTNVFQLEAIVIEEVTREFHDLVYED